MKKLTKKEIDARMVIYDEVIGHLEMSICDTKEEIKQANIVKKQIQKISDKFYNRYVMEIKS